MDEGTPTKPPRGVKQYKEPSGLLMSLIRTLSTYSDTDEQRDKEKGKLEKDYKKSNKKLEELVSLHDNDLTQVMQLFVKVSTQITASREKIRAVKNNLQSCKTLLRCRRDELKKLWLEGIEHKHALQLLEEIDQLRDVPSQLGIYLAKKEYLQATRLLMSALSLGDGNLEGVEALREVRTELQAKKQILHTKLMEELKLHLYVLPTTEALSFRRQGSGRDNLLSPFQRAGDLRGSNRSSRAKRKLLEVSRSGLGGELEHELQNLPDDADDLDPEERTEHFTSVIIECLGLLQKIPDAVEVIKAEMDSELTAIVSRTTKSILDAPQSVTSLAVYLENNKPTEPEPQRLLLELLETIFDQFRRVATAHSIVLNGFNKVAEKYRIDVRLYEMPDVWSKIQAVLQNRLTDYLDVDVISNPLQTPAYAEPTTDISSYFSKRKPQRQKKVHLFKFDYSTHSFSVKDQMGRSARDKEKQLVCQPDMKNITVIFIPLSKFIQEIEQALDSGPNNPCTLNTFISEYVKNIFVQRHHLKVSSAIEAATKAQDAWKSITDPDLTKKMGLSRPILQSTVTVERCIVGLRELMRSLPAFADRFLSIICNILRAYRETCQAAYRGIVQPDSEDKRICSAAWLKDDDISRFIKSLPNWMELQAHKPTHRRGRTIRREETTEEESPEDIRQRNVKEAEILASNMGEAGISAHEILSNVSQLKKLAQLHESMEWFAAQILLVIKDVREVSAEESSSDLFKCHIPDTAIQSLYQLVHEFTDLADICLLVLHLEVRVQCFHYLLPRSGGSPQKFDFNLYQEPDPKVQELSRVLINVDEAMVSSLQPRKTKYIFEGLGHLIAKILISSSQYMDKIDENGIQRMCRNIFALQQTLTNITSSREVALDHAKQFFEMFYRTPDEILSTVLDKGPQFTDMEYMNALQLLNRSYPDKFGNVNQYLKRLSDILGEIGVTV